MGRLFAVINANLGGAKSNLFITYDVLQEVAAPADGMISKTVEITYKNNRRADNCNLEAGLLCLNSTLRDWTRIYVPQGSELVDATGFTQDAKVYDELGFTVLTASLFWNQMGWQNFDWPTKFRMIKRLPTQGVEARWHH